MSERSSVAPAEGDVATLTFRPMERTEADLSLFQRAFDDNASPRSHELLRWQYFEPPAGKLFVDLAVTPGTVPRLAAIYAVFPVAMRIEGRPALGVQSLNTLTDLEFRGKGLFTRLAKSLYARSAADGVAVVYGFPNGNSVHGLYKKLDWKPLDPMPMLVRPLRLGWLVSRLTRGRLSLPRWLDPSIPSRRRRLPAGLELRPVDVTTEGDAMTAIWQRFARDIGFAVERRKDYLQWRLRRPGATYDITGLFRGTSLIGYVITAIARRNRACSGKIMDLVYDPAESEAGALLLGNAFARLRQAGCGPVWAWNYDHSPNHSDFRAAGFLQVPHRMIPDQQYSGARSLTEPPSAAAAVRANWYISMLDSDTD